MSTQDRDGFELETAALELRARCIPWDSEIFGFPVAAIEGITVTDGHDARRGFAEYQKWVRSQSIQLVSCRLPHERLESSMFLERHDFRFVEMVLHPTLRELQSLPEVETSLDVEPVLESELAQVVAMAERAFGWERYHVDPRMDSRLADQRYGRWVRNSFRDPRQQLLKIVLGSDIAGFFVIENQEDGTVYWHLTALEPELKGKKIGVQVWRSMIAHSRKAGMDRILTTIAARNTPVLNLYSKLNFRFAPPEMTLHWLAADQRQC